jgi:hypothetical protein
MLHLQNYKALWYCGTVSLVLSTFDLVISAREGRRDMHHLQPSSFSRYVDDAIFRDLTAPQTEQQLECNNNML